MTLDITLSQLENAQLIRRSKDDGFSFRHTLVQDTAYTSLLKENRKRMHRAVGEALEVLYPEQLEENSALLARHFAEAGDETKTVLYAVRAGDRAARVFANAEALEFYSLALELSRQAGMPREAIKDLYLKRGRIFELLDQYDSALGNYLRMGQDAGDHEDSEMELAALMARATIHAIPSSQFDPRTAEALSNQALELARESSNPAAVSKILWNLMLLNSRLDSQYQLARQYGEESLTIAQANGLKEQVAYDLNDLAIIYLFTGEPDRAKQSLFQARDYWLAQNNLPMLSDNYGYEAMLSSMGLSEFEQAVKASKEGSAVSERIGNLWGVVFNNIWVGRAYFELGLVQDALRTMEDEVARAPHSNFIGPLFTSADLAKVYGDLGEAKHGIALTIPLLKQLNPKYPIMQFWVYGVLADLYLQIDDIIAAEKALKEGYALLDSGEPVVPFGIYLRLARADVALIRGENDRAVELAATIISDLESLHLRFGLNRARILLARSRHAQGKSQEAFTILEQARIGAETCKSRWDLWQVYALQGEIASQINPKSALGYFESARKQINMILLHIPTTGPNASLRESFSNLPLVRSVLEQTR